eukprot:jgi/Tetstr1/458239/TSEL_044727.t1
MVSKPARSGADGGSSGDGGKRGARGGKGVKAGKQAAPQPQGTRQPKRAPGKGVAVRGGRAQAGRSGRGGRGSGRGPNGGWRRGAEVVGRLLDVYWTSRKQWLEGKVDQYNKRSGKHHITYKTGDEHWIVLGEKRLRWVAREEGDSSGEEGEEEEEGGEASGAQEDAAEQGADAEEGGDEGAGDDEDGGSDGGSAHETPVGERTPPAGKADKRANVAVDGGAKEASAAPEADLQTSTGGAQAAKDQTQPKDRPVKPAVTAAPVVSAGKASPAGTPARAAAPQGLPATKGKQPPTPKQQGTAKRGGAGTGEGAQKGAAPSLGKAGQAQRASAPPPATAAAATPPTAAPAGAAATQAAAGATPAPKEQSPRKEAATPAAPAAQAAAAAAGPASPAGGRTAQGTGPERDGNGSHAAAVLPAGSQPCAPVSEDRSADAPKAADTGTAPAAEPDKRETAQVEASAAWQQAREMADKAVRLVKLAQEGGGMDRANAGMDTAEDPHAVSERGPLSPTGRKGAASGRRKQQASSSGAKQGAANGPGAAVRARVSVFWPGDQVYYKGRIIDYNREKSLHCIRYDDNEEEWLNLSEEYFKWLGPRARSAGYSPALAAAVMALGPDGITPPSVAALAEKTREADTSGPRGHNAVGYRIGILWEADGAYHHGEVLAYIDHKHKHHILYDDGEDEWIQLTKEAKVWRHKGRGASLPAGIAQGDSAPRGRSAIGWRIGVYWKEDTVFYEGEIKGYDSATGKHHILYDDSEDEYISLSTEKIKWMVPPGLVTEKKGHRSNHRGSYARPGKKAPMSAAAAAPTGPPTSPTSKAEPPAPSAPVVASTKAAAAAPVRPGADKPAATGPPARDGAVIRKIRRCTLQDGGVRSESGDEYMRVSITGPLRRKSSLRAAAAPSDSQPRGAEHGPLLARLSVVEAMLARVVVAQEALKLGCPAGAQACRAAAAQVARGSMPLPPAGLRRIRTKAAAAGRSAPPPAPPDAAMEASPKCATPTAFQLEMPTSPIEDMSPATGGGSAKGASQHVAGQPAGVANMAPSLPGAAEPYGGAARGAKVRPASILSDGQGGPKGA